MLPFVTCDPLRLGPLSISPWAIFTAIGFFTWDIVTTRHARRLGYDHREMRALQLWGIFVGVYGSHILDTLFNAPEELLRRPWALLLFWERLSSMGGILGCVTGAVIWKYYRFRIENGQPELRRRPVPLPLLPMADIIVSAMPLGFGFGRAGCAIVHDHPGKEAPASELLAVAFPRAPGEGLVWSWGPIHVSHGSAPRYDLGLIECLFLAILALAVGWTWLQPKRPPMGMYTAILCLVYAPVRFVLDFLRLTEEQAGDRRLLSLTFAQWTCIAMFTFGAYMLHHARRLSRTGEDPGEVLRSPAPLDGDPVASSKEL